MLAAVLVEAAEVEAEAAATAVEDTKVGAEAWVRVALVQKLEDWEMPQGCECAMKRISPPYPFGTGKHNAPF